MCGFTGFTTAHLARTGSVHWVAVAEDDSRRRDTSYRVSTQPTGFNQWQGKQ
jgi:hypothetical protein